MPDIRDQDPSPPRRTLTRAGFLGLAAGATLSLAGRAQAQSPAGAMLKRPIPSSGETLPVIGCGTARVFDVGETPEERAPLGQVLHTLFEAGGTVVDTSPMYGPAEGVVGDLLQASGERGRAFLATKVWTKGREAGIAQMEESFRLLHTDKIDLMQVHNLIDWQVHLPTLRDWKQAGRIRYTGVTHYTETAYGELEKVMRAERFDFVQLNYSADDRAAESRILPLAAERGMAVLVNRPFGGGGLLRRLQGKPLPDFALELGASTWPQLLLKFVLGHPAVTCAIPGTAKANHMRGNAEAGGGTLPDAAMRERIAALVA